MKKQVKAGIIGCGNISDIYLTNLKNTFEIIDLVGCADIIHEKAKEKAEKYEIKAYTVDELLADSDIEIILNLTIPNVHYEVSNKILDAGKNVYVEKPLCISREDGRKLLQKAKEKNLLISSAPDTFLGAGIQTCKKLIDDGWIGRPVAATAFMCCHGHEGWHPDPEFYYKLGAGPMFDMGPYYLTALIHLLGPARRVSGSTNITFPERIIGSEKKKGNIIDVEVPTHISGTIDFKSGAIGTIITSFDVWSHTLPHIEIYGSNGSIRVPDPNTFGGPVFFKGKNDKDWSEIPLLFEYSENSRGIGVADMATALQTDRNHKANGELAFHVLELMHGFHDSSDLGKHYVLGA